MSRQLHRLNALKVRTLGKPGMYGDGGNLWLQVSPSGSKSWIFRFMQGGRGREMGLGSALVVTLVDARKQASECRRQLSVGLDPIQQREAAITAVRLEAAKSVTFKKCAELYIAAHESGWSNEKHVSQWRNTLRDYAFPLIGDLPVSDVGLDLVVKVLEPIWHTKPETASRLRGRMESILDWATVRQYRKGENPARWKGHLDHVLPNRTKVAAVRHHAALPFGEIGRFMASLRAQEGIGARALEFTILTASRTTEALLAEWPEFDFIHRLWTVPASRMKASKEHRVPLSEATLRVLAVMREQSEGKYVFPGAKDKRPLSNMAMLAVLRRMERTDLTVHGFRSTFRDWVAEATTYSHEMAEMALAHTIGNKVEAAYRRGDLYQKRCRMMEEWATYCDEPEPRVAEVIHLRNIA